MPHTYNKIRQRIRCTEEIALAEAQRCLNCKNKPCVAGCPVNVNIPDFIMKIKEKDYEGAYQVINKTSTLPAVCGRVCPQETQCEAKCTMGIKFEPVGIGRLERFVADWHNANATEKAEAPASNGHKVAVVGSGPSGLTCAGDLAKKGYEVSVFEALHTAGGVLVLLQETENTLHILVDTYLVLLPLRLGTRSVEIQQMEPLLYVEGQNLHRIVYFRTGIWRTTLAGRPVATVQAGMSLVTSDPAPTIAPSPMVTWGITIESIPIRHPFFRCILP